MRDPDVRDTVGELLKQWPFATHVLKRHGIEDLLWWSGTKLGDVCRELKLDPAPILADVMREGLEPPKPRSAMVFDPGSEQEVKAAAEAERAEIEAELADYEAEAEAAAQPPAPPEQEIPDVAAMFKARPAQPAQPRPKRTAPPPKPAAPQKPALSEEEARARAEAEAALAAEIPDVAKALRGRPVAPPPPPPEAEAPDPKAMPAGEDGSLLSQIMKWGKPE